MHTTVAPTGVEARIEQRIPDAAQITDKTADMTTTPKKFLKIRMAESAGKIIKAEISKEPASFMASTITDAVTTAINRSYRFTFIPVAWANVSSKVTANIR